MTSGLARVKVTKSRPLPARRSWRNTARCARPPRSRPRRPRPHARAARRGGCAQAAIIAIKFGRGAQAQGPVATEHRVGRVGPDRARGRLLQRQERAPSVPPAWAARSSSSRRRPGGLRPLGEMVAEFQRQFGLSGNAVDSPTPCEHSASRCREDLHSSSGAAVLDRPPRRGRAVADEEGAAAAAAAGSRSSPAPRRSRRATSRSSHEPTAQRRAHALPVPQGRVHRRRDARRGRAAVRALEARPQDARAHAADAAAGGRRRSPAEQPRAAADGAAAAGPGSAVERPTLMGALGDEHLTINVPEQERAGRGRRRVSIADL